MHACFHSTAIVMVGASLMLLSSGCAQPKVFVATGTLVGLEATPGNPEEGQTPAVTFGYRRAEVALVPVEKQDDKKKDNTGSSGQHRGGTSTNDAASVLATFNLAYNWFGPARIEQYLATGLASRTLVKSNQYALTLIGYEKGTDTLADHFAGGYKNAVKEGANSTDKDCWDNVTKWMKGNFPGMPPMDILTKGFIKQRKEAAKNYDVKTACKIPPELLVQ